MNILYISCHAVLEYEEVKIFHELGFNVFSLHGSYQNPENPAEDFKRPGIPGFKPDQHLLDLAIQCTRENIHDDYFKWADVIIIMHKIDWATSPVKWLRDIVKRSEENKVALVWRTIGQSHQHWEKIIKDNAPQLKIVRYSPKERNIPDFAGENALIRFPVDKNEYKDWTGGNNKIHVYGQSLKERGDYSNFSLIEDITRDYPRVAYGTKNSKEDAKKPKDIIDWSGGPLTYPQLKESYQKADAAFYTGIIPASYTLTFVEMMMTGVPIVATGKNLFNLSRHFPGHDLYEIPDIIKNGKNGFVSDSLIELKQNIYQLLNDPDLRVKISEGARQTAIELFDKEKIKSQWKDFLNSL